MHEFIQSICQDAAVQTVVAIRHIKFTAVDDLTGATTKLETVSFVYVVGGNL